LLHYFGRNIKWGDRVAVNRFVRICLLFIALGLATSTLHAADCAGLPVTFPPGEFPTGNFFSNFANSCYEIGIASGYGSTKYGDLNAVYYEIYFKVDPQYQLILVGPFPNTRYFSVALNDAHSALSGSILDTDIVPLTAEYINPYQVGVPYVAGQQYAIPINFGGTLGKVQTGCSTAGFNVDVNALDATQRHTGMDWNSVADLFQQNPAFPDHIIDTPQHTNPNTAGVIMVRAYMDDSPLNAANSPQIIVRDVASGCAYPAQYAVQTLQIVTNDAATGEAWLDHDQYEDHHEYETNFLPKLCNADPAAPDALQWSRQPEYVPATNPNAAYIVAPVPSGLPATLAAAGEVMRVRLRMPATPPTPCADGCSRSGTEQMRYMSLSFSYPGGHTMASLDDTAFTKDKDGFATLIVGTGATIPAWVTAANGYTYLDLTTLDDYLELSLLSVRHIIPGTGFTCAGQFVPYRTSVDTPAGSLLGDYTPVVDYPTAASLPKKAAPLSVTAACGTYPDGNAGARPSCGVFPAAAPSISGAVTQCSAPGCTEFAAQANPPITINGAGFGVFPLGAPFTGTSKYLELEDATQGWQAGYAGSNCTVSISEWDTDQIQLVANVPNENGKCQLVSGDKIRIEVWNPQSAVSATFTTTAE